MLLPQTQQAILDYLQDRDHCFAWDPSLGVANTRHWGQCGCYGISLRLFEQEPLVVCISRLGIKVQFDDQPRVLQYLTRVNHGLVLGNFEMDFEDGEIRCRIGFDHENTEISTENIRHLVQSTVELCDHYFYGLLRILYGGFDPEFEADRADQESPWA